MATRNEIVRLTLQDDFTSGTARAAMSARALADELDRLDRSGQSTSSAFQRNSTSTDQFTASMSNLNQQLRDGNGHLGELNGRNGLGGFNNNANTAGRSINQLTGRLRLFVDLAAMLAPALVPIGSLGVPAISGLASQLGIAAAAGGTALLAFQGVGDALKAVNKAAEEPSFENLRAAEIALEGLAPATQRFVKRLHEMNGEFGAFRNAAAQGLFSELNKDFGDLEGVMDRLTPVVERLGQGVGAMLADGITSLDSARWQDFFTFLAAEARPALAEMGQTLGNFAHGLAEMWMAMDPFNDSFSGWMLNVSESFDGWAQGLAQTQGFADFLDYVQDTGPQVADTFGALGSALLQVLDAMSPIGGPVLAIIEALADGIGAIADSDFGTPIFIAAAAMATFSRATALWGATATTSSGIFIRGQLAAGAALRANIATMMQFGAMSSTQIAQQQAAAAAVRSAAIKGAAGIGFMVAAMSDLDDKAGVSNTAMGALLGTMVAPGWGTAIGALAGGAMDVAAANNDLDDAVNRANAAMSDTASLKERGQALTQLKAELEDAEEKTDAFWHAIKGGAIADAVTGKKNPLTSVIDAWKGFGLEVTGSTQEAKDAIESLEGSGGGLSTILAPGINMTAGAFNSAAMSAQDFAAALERVNNVLTGQASIRDYKAALDEFTAGLEDNGRTMDINTAKGRANEENLGRIAETALKVAENLKGTDRTNYLQSVRGDLVDAASKLDMGEKATKRFNAVLKELDNAGAKPDVDVDTKPAQAKIGATAAMVLRLNSTKGTATALLNDLATGKINSVQGLIRRYGMTRAQATALLKDLATGDINAVTKRLSTLDKAKANPKVTAETAAAQSAVNAIIGALGRIPRSITTTVTTVRRTIGGAGDFVGGAFNAEGNFFPTVRSYAGGDVRDRHEPEVARGGTWRVWAEDETGGESYIPHANDHRRPRAKSILEETAGLFGGRVEWYAGGGTRGSRNAGLGDLLAMSTREAQAGLDALGVTAQRVAVLADARERKDNDQTKTRHDRIQKQLDRELASKEKILSAEKARLDQLRQEREEIARAVSDRFRSDLWGQEPTLHAFSRMGLDEDREREMLAYALLQNGKIKSENEVSGNSLAELRYMTSTPSSPTSILSGDLAQAREMKRLIAQLKRKGLDGAALANVITNAPIEQIRGYAAGSRQQLGEFEFLFNQRETFAAAAGNAGGVAVLGADIRAQRRATELARDAVRATNQEIKQLRRDVKELKQATSVDGPDRTASGLANALNRSAARAARASS